MRPDVEAEETAAWWSAVPAVARRIGSEDYPSGDLAQLRRLEPKRPEGSAFWRLVAEHLPAAFDEHRLQAAFAATVRGMALAVPFHRLPEGERRSMGRALAEADVSEARLLRLLRADRVAFPEELRRLARLVQAKGNVARFGWVEAMRLALTAGGGGDDETRRPIAKEYYRTLLAAERQKETATA